MSSKPSEHDEIIAEAREKYTVHNCSQCEFRKSCNIEFDSDECKEVRQSIMLGLGIEDGYFTKLLDRLEAAHKRESVTDCNGLNTNPAGNVNSEKVIYNGAKMREALMKVSELIHDEAKWADEMSNHQAIALGIIQSALSAPARNCDLYNNVAEAWRTYVRIHPDDTAMNPLWHFSKWLFAKAEGGAE